MEHINGFRKLNVRIQKPRPLNSRFAWLAGIALLVVFLACVVMAYVAHHVQHN